MTQALIEIQRVLSEANAAGKLTDTIWRGPAETLFDYIQNEIDAAGTTGCTDQPQIAEPEKFTVDSEMSRAFEIEYGQDWKDPDWRRETGVWASAWHKATNAARAAAPQAVQPAVPVLFVSREQLESHTDHLASEAGRYLPARKTAVGKFTMPLYAHPAEGVPAQDAEAKIEELLALARIMVRTALDADNKTQVQEIKAAIESEVAFERALRAALAATQPAAQGLEQHAERWGEVLRHVGAAPHFGGQHFTLNTLQAPDTALGFKANLMSGSVAQHFTKAIDAERAARAKQGGA